MHPSPTHFSTAAGRQGETSRRTSDVSYFLTAAPCNWDNSRSPNSGAMRSTFGSRHSSTSADPPWRATPRNPRTSPPWRPNSRVAMSSPILLWCAAPRTLRTGAVLQAPPPELLAPERGHAPPAAQRGGVGARRLERIRLATGTRSWRRENSLDGLDQADTRTSINLGDVPLWLRQGK